MHFRQMAAVAMQSDMLVDSIKPILESLTAETEETSLFARLSPDHASMYFAAIAHSPHPLRYKIELNVPLPLSWGASGLSILASQSDVEIQAVIDQQTESPTSGKVRQRADLDALLKQVRADGYAKTFGEKLPQAVGLSVPFFGGDRLLGSLSLTIPEPRLDASREDEFVSALKAHARF